MAAPVPRRTKPQGDQFLISTQNGWLGGLNVDMSPASIDATECPVLENLVAFRQGLRSVKGSHYREDLTPPVAGGIPAWDSFFGVKQLSNGSILALYGYGGFIFVWRKATASSPWTSLRMIGTRIPDSSGILSVSIEEAPSCVVILVTTATTSILETYDVNTGAYTVRTPLDTPTGATTHAGWCKAEYAEGYYYGARFRLAKAVFTTSDAPDIVNHPERWARESPAQTNYVESWSAFPISGVYGDDPWFDMATVGELDTMYAVYRTKNIGYVVLGDGSKVAADNDSEQYFLCGFCIRTSGGVSQFYPIAPGQPTFPTDAQLTIGNMPYGTSSMLTGTPSFMRLSSGYLFIGKKYCSTQILRRLGLHLAGVQELSSLGDPTDIVVGTDSAMILCPTRTEKVSLYTDVNAGNSDYGEYYPLLSTPSIVDTTVGVRNRGSISQFSNAAFFAQCSDGSVRIWDGSAWSLDLTRGRLERFVRRSDQTGWGISSSSGVYYLKTTQEEEEGTVTRLLRLSIQEKAGNGWSVITDTTAQYGKYPLLYREQDGEHLVIFPVYPEIPVEIEHEDYDSFFDGEIPCKFSTREIEGAKPGTFVRHLKTTVKVVPLPGKILPEFGVKFRLYVDDGVGPVHESRLHYATMTAVFNGEAVGNRFRVEMETDRGGFFITSVSTEFQSMDARPLSEVSTEADYDLAFNGYLTGWFNRVSPTTDSSGILGDHIGNTSILTAFTGQDGGASSGWRSSGGASTYLLPPGTLQQSLSSWVTLSDGTDIAISLQSFLVMLEYVGGKWVFGLYKKDPDGTNPVLVGRSDEVVREDWNHICLSANPPSGGDMIGSVSLYVNGVLATQSVGYPSAMEDLANSLILTNVGFDTRVMDTPILQDAIKAYISDCTAGRYCYHPGIN